MTKRTRYTISLLPTDTDILEHLEQIKEQTNISMYVRKLIKSDMAKNFHEANDMEKLIELVIERIKEDNELHLTSASRNEENKEITITDEQRDIISSLF